MKLGIGTVQFGLDYGLSNKEGQTPQNEVRKILEVAAASGVQLLDTAALYGISEAVLGRALPPGHTFDIVTKTPVFSYNRVSPADARQLEDTFQQSLSRMQQERVYGLLVHHAGNLLADGGELLMEKMLDLKHQGLVKKLGASVYTAEQIDWLLGQYELDLIQLPVNILDQRLVASGHLAKLKRAGVEIHARSVFLQGLLLMEPDTLPPYFEPVREHLRRYRAHLDGWGLSPLQAALGFVVGLEEVDVAICGVNTHQQLEELVRLAKPLPDLDRLADFAIDDPAVLDPSRWPK